MKEFEDDFGVDPEDWNDSTFDDLDEDFDGIDIWED